jgi:hypothetical protein
MLNHVVFVRYNGVKGLYNNKAQHAFKAAKNSAPLHPLTATYE